MTTETRYDIVAIGNAIVDVISQASDDFLDEEQLVKGSMALVDADRARELYRDMGPAREISGGSGANTLAGASTLGRQCALIAQVADDQLGEVFAHDIRATGIDFDVPPHLSRRITISTAGCRRRQPDCQRRNSLSRGLSLGR